MIRAQIDGVDGAEPEALFRKGVVEHVFDQGLAIVERAFDGDVMNIARRDGGHLPPLLRDPASKDEA